MSDIFDSLETGDRCTLEVPGFAISPHPSLGLAGGEEHDTCIASFNLIGKIRWNQDLGKLIAQRVRQTIPNLEGLCFLTVVEKALQLTQVVAAELGVEDVAIAYNRVKPHMETSRRPVIQVAPIRSRAE